MNRLQKNNARKEALNAFRAMYPEGCAKWSNETLEHYTVKCQALHWFKKNGYDVWTEPVMINNKGRPDLVVVHSNGDAYCVEILKTETEAKFLHKETDYPLPIIKIYTKDWDYESFAI